MPPMTSAVSRGCILPTMLRIPASNVSARAGNVHATRLRATSTAPAPRYSPSPTPVSPDTMPRVDPARMIASELTYIRETLVNLLGSSHPALTEIADYYFHLSGKQLRPQLVLLFSCATNGLASGFNERALSPLNIQTGPKRFGLDMALSSPFVLNDWNPRMPDFTSSFVGPFDVHDRTSRSHNPPTQTSLSTLSRPSPDTILHAPPSATILPTQLRLAQITEMIHVASLLHDDVLDHASTRRSAPSAPSAFGNKLSVLGGDFLFGRASTALARLGDNEVVELVASVMSNLVEGEVMQMIDNQKNSNGKSLKDDSSQSIPAAPTQDTWTQYICKSYFKTASLMAKSVRASVVLGGAQLGDEQDEALKDVAYAYGRNLGIAFQLIDDALDFSSSTEIGKPGNGADLKLGLATAPVLFAWEEHPQMGALVVRRFEQEGDVELARELVHRSNALARTHQLAKDYASKALEALNLLPWTEARDALVSLAGKAVDRAK
ncbi:hexaprenyl pyrophosphate synthase [Cantharellus anzutake]|uniref:hexaprenyl pyrophosphate synthase n=1 Tax=Cantharellus anzutake TaxID=1750568 RepID=UPI00190570C4|nr:hexaprenyl pyrophosphate synthase [Cantharellus anzutake]KAF8336377.1 hexaprenyl pyrophosphate synthase [Cantharellus anzutake]